MSESPDGEKVRVTMSLSGDLPLSTCLMRSRPAADEGPAQAWQLAQEIIDHAAYLLETLNTVEEGRKVRDLVLSALLRRAVLLAEGVRVNLYHGLEEPAIVLLRALLEVELNMRLVTADPDESMAKRLAAYHHLKAKRHVTKALGHPEVQTGASEFKQFMKDVGKRQKDFFASSTFDDIREELSTSQHWHGHRSIEAAFDSVDGGTDYLHLYDSFSPFVHTANLDHDFVDIIDGKPHLRPLPQREPTRVQHYLKGGALMLLRIMTQFVEDKSIENYSSSFTVELESGESLKISPLLALQQYAVAVWGVAEGWSIDAKSNQQSP